MRNFGCIIVWLILGVPLIAQINHGLRDENGRHVIARGFVINTDDGSYKVDYSDDDYARMVRLGANFQVIRLELGKLSNFPGCRLDREYLRRLDTLVQRGRQAGIKTMFKMTVYGVRHFSWESFWRNKNHEQQIYLDAWKILWNRYLNEPYVYGYDLVNEPRKLSMNVSYDALTNDYLIPCYQRLIDECNKIGGSKKCLFQSIFMNKGEAVDGNQYAEIKKPLNRDNMIFAPHMYVRKNEQIKRVLARFEKEAKIQNAPLFLGEWGFPTFETTDSTLSGELGQLMYQQFYIYTGQEIDRLGIGTIKPWFMGSRRMQHLFKSGPSTWAIFQDKKSIGTAERKYITDVIARPFPQVIAGDIQSFLFDPATRTLSMSITADNSKGASRIFVGANRHYPDGFTFRLGEMLNLYHNPLKTIGLEVFKSAPDSDPSDFIWDSSRQQLIVLSWPQDKTKIDMTIVPGIKID